MKVLFWIGLVVLVLGVASLAVPIPRTEKEGVKAAAFPWKCRPSTAKPSRPSSVR